MLKHLHVKIKTFLLFSGLFSLAPYTILTMLG